MNDRAGRAAAVATLVVAAVAVALAALVTLARSGAPVAWWERLGAGDGGARAGTPSPSAQPASAVPALVGTWQAHGATLTIRRDGSAEALWRTYRWCRPGNAAPCDTLEGSFIRPGGKAVLQFALAPDAGDVAPGAPLAGTVVSTTQPSRLPLGEIWLRLLPGGTARLVLDPRAVEGLLPDLCGPVPSPAGAAACGA